MRNKLLLGLLSFSFVLLCNSAVTHAQMDITTWQVDTSHSGLNANESMLTPNTVGGGNLSCLFVAQVDGQVNAQPLYLTAATSSNLPGSFPDGAPHNAVYVATQNATVYAINGDIAGDGCGQIHTNYLWSDTLANLSTGPTPNGTPEFYEDIGGAADISPLFGLTETPVIDPATGTLYVVVTIRDTSAADAANHPELGLSPATPFVQILYALDVKTGAVKGWTPINFQTNGDYTPSCPSSGSTCDNATAPAGQIPFIPANQHLRAGMIFDKTHSTVWLTWASHNDQKPYWGLIAGYNVSDPTHMTLNATFNTSPSGSNEESGIWMSGASPGLDPTTNQLFVSTGNGTWDQNASQNTQNTNWAMSVLSLSSDPSQTVMTNGVPEMQLPFVANCTQSNSCPWFTPVQWNDFNNGDRDLGSGGLLLLPTTLDKNGAPINLMIGGGKSGAMYLLNRANLGGGGASSTLSSGEPDNAPNPNAIQQIIEPSGSIFDTPTYFNGNIYYSASAAVHKRAFGYDAATETYISPTETMSTQGAFNHTPGTFISASSPTTDGIIWEISNGLFAWDATNITNTLYSQSVNVPIPPGSPSGTNLGSCLTATFALPIVDNGKVYFTCYQNNPTTAPADNKPGYLFVYGIVPPPTGAPSATPVITSVVANSSSQITLNWSYSGTDNPSFLIYRSTSSTNFPTQPLNTGNLQSPTSFFIDNTVVPNTTYFYRVQATNTSGNSSLMSNTASASTLPLYEEAGLVAYWPLDEGVAQGLNATSSADVTGHGHTASKAGGEDNSQPNGLINGDWFWHGTHNADPLIVADAPDLDFTSTQSFTLTAWVFPDDVPGQPGGEHPGESALIVKSADQGSLYGLFINGAGNWVFRGPAGDLVGPVAQAQTWTHVAAVQDGVHNIRTLYINGVPSANTAPAQNANGAGQLWFGDQNAVLSNGSPDENGIDGYPGELDEIRLYNTALSQGAIKDLMGDPILSAVSLQPSGPQGAQTTSGIQLFPSPVPLTEPRIPANQSQTYTLQVKFAAPLTSTPNVALLGQAGNSQVMGSVSAVTIDSTNTIVTVGLTGVTNPQALDLQFTNVNSGQLNSETQDILFNVNYGDVSQDHIVDHFDSNAITAAFSNSVNASNAIFDLNGDGVIDQNDVNLVASGSSQLTSSADAPLAFFKIPAGNASIPFASSTNGGNIPANAFDNNLNDNWETVHPPNGNANQGVAGVDPGWIYVDLGKPATVDGFAIQWGGSAAQVYTIDACAGSGAAVDVNGNCSTGWQNMVTENSGVNNELKSYLDLSPVSAEFFRMNGTVRVNAPFGYQIDEFYIYGTYTPSGTQPTNPSPAAPTLAQPAVASGQVNLSWSASANAASYSVFRSTSQGTEGLLISGITNTSYTDNTVINGTTYFYDVEAVGNGGTTSIASNEVQATPQGVLAAPVLNQPSTVSGQVALGWSASPNAASYSVFRGTSQGTESLLVSGLTVTSFVDKTVVNGTTYFYDVEAVGNGGTTSIASNEVQATPQASSVALPDLIAINAGSSTAVSGPVNTFVADVDFQGGNDDVVNNPITIPASVSSIAAPAAVYQSAHQGAVTYTIATPDNNPYTVVLHFAELFFNAAKQRMFNVAINNQPVAGLQNFDIFAAAGNANFTAVVQQIQNVIPINNQITISFTNGTNDQPMVNGIEIVPTTASSISSGLSTPVLNQPSTASDQVILTWSASSNAAFYSVFRGTSKGGESLLVSDVATASYVDNTVVNGTTYFYYVKANGNGNTTSGSSNEVQATPQVLSITLPDLIAIDTGSSTPVSGPVNTFVADTDFQGGNDDVTNNPIIIPASVASIAAPAVVYQSAHQGTVTYTIATPDNNPYIVVLHFAELYFNAPNQRMFNVAINNQPIMGLQNFDIFAAAGNANFTAVIRQIQNVIPINNQITIAFTNGSNDQPMVNGIEVVPQ